MTMDVRGDTLVVSVSGDRPASDADARDELIARWYRVAEVCKLRGLVRVLFVSNIESLGSSAVTHSIFSDFDRFGIDRSTRIAIVRFNARALRVVQLGVKVARERGWRMQIFADIDTAQLWLAGEAD